MTEFYDVIAEAPAPNGGQWSVFRSRHTVVMRDGDGNSIEANLYVLPLLSFCGEQQPFAVTAHPPKEILAAWFKAGLKALEEDG